MQNLNSREKPLVVFRNKYKDDDDWLLRLKQVILLKVEFTQVAIKKNFCFSSHYFSIQFATWNIFNGPWDYYILFWLMLT